MAQDQVQGLLFNRLFGQKTDGPAGLLGNPMLQVGMGLLASRADPRINPFGAAMSGLTNAAQFRQIEEDRKREMEERERMDKVREQLSKIIPGMFSTRVEGPPTPDGIAPTQMDPMGAALGEVAQLDPLGAFDMLTRMNGPGGDQSMINAITPGHYKPASVERFNQSVMAGRPDYSLLEIASPFPTFESFGGGGYWVDRDGRRVDPAMIPGPNGPMPATPPNVGTAEGQNDAAQADVVAAADARRQAQSSGNRESLAALKNELDWIRGNKEAFTNIFGTIDAATPDLMPGSVEAEARRTRVINLLTLAARGELEGQGPISDTEQKLLMNAATLLSERRIPDRAALDEVDRAYEVMLRQMNAAGMTNSAPAVRGNSEKIGNATIQWED